MTDEEMNLWQTIDEMRDRIEELEKQMADQVKAFTVAVNLIADGMEQRNERS